MDSLGGLPVNVEHCRARATCRVHTRTRSGTSTSCNESRPLALRDEETAWSGDSGPGATNERRRHLTAIRELAM